MRQSLLVMGANPAWQSTLFFAGLEKNRVMVIAGAAAVLFALSGLSCSAGYRIEHISVFKDLCKYSSLATA